MASYNPVPYAAIYFTLTAMTSTGCMGVGRDGTAIYASDAISSFRLGYPTLPFVTAKYFLSFITNAVFVLGGTPGIPSISIVAQSNNKYNYFLPYANLVEVQTNLTDLFNVFLTTNILRVDASMNCTIGGSIDQSYFPAASYNFLSNVYLSNMVLADKVMDVNQTAMVNAPQPRIASQLATKGYVDQYNYELRITELENHITFLMTYLWNLVPNQRSDGRFVIFSNALPNIRFNSTNHSNANIFIQNQLAYNNTIAINAVKKVLYDVEGSNAVTANDTYPSLAITSELSPQITTDQVSA